MIKERPEIIIRLAKSLRVNPFTIKRIVDKPIAGKALELYEKCTDLRYWVREKFLPLQPAAPEDNSKVISIENYR